MKPVVIIASISIVSLILIVYFLMRPAYSCYDAPKKEGDAPEKKEEAPDATTAMNEGPAVSGEPSDASAPMVDSSTASAGIPFSTTEPVPMKVNANAVKFVPVPSDYLASLQDAAAQNSVNQRLISDISERIKAR